MKHQKSRRIFIISMACLLFLGIGMAFLFQRITAPSIGVTREPPQDIIPVAESPTLTKGTYAQFMLPPTYELKNNVPEANSLERFIFSGKPMDERLLAITIASMPPSGRLEDDSSYRTRQLHPEMYTEETYPANSGTVVLMKHKSKFEWVGYLVNNGLLAVVALSSRDPEPKQLAQEYYTLIDSWQWVEQ